MTRKFLILFFLILSSCKNEQEYYEVENKILKAENDSLKKKIENDKSYWFSNQSDLEKSLNVEDSLRKHFEIIPLKSALAGNMEYGKILKISENWIIADYSDGHVEGTSIWQYKVTPKGEVEFFLLNSVQP